MLPKMKSKLPQEHEVSMFDESAARKVDTLTLGSPRSPMVHVSMGGAGLGFFHGYNPWDRPHKSGYGTATTCCALNDGYISSCS
jgi:hypothetical protein